LRRIWIPKLVSSVDLLNYLGLPLLAIYVFSVFVFPWLASAGDWKHVQAVWDRWQTLNAGALAFLASLVAFNIARFSENEQRERDFRAAKAFLPSTLSSLMEYCSASARLLDTLWRTSGERRAPLECVRLPDGYREVLSNCIRHSTPEVGEYLVRILVRLQVHDARLRDAVARAPGSDERVTDRHSLLAYVLRLGELYALLGGIFGFAREEEPFLPKNLAWDELRSAYRVLDLEIDDLYIDEKMNLEAFSIRWLERTNTTQAQARK
jgi:hypothetical protein